MDEKPLEKSTLEEGITLVELFNSLKHNLILMIGIGIFVVALGIIYTWFLVTPMYTSSVDLHIYNVNENVTTVNQIKNNVKEIAKYDEIVEAVVLKLGLEYQDLDAKVKSIKSRISTSDIGSASAVKVSYEDSDPIMATRIVNAIADETARRVNIPKGNEESLAFSEEELIVINRPKEDPNQAPSSPNKVLNLAISVVLGGIIAVVVVILKEQFSLYFKSKQEVERITKYSVIAAIPAQKGVKFGE